MGPNENISVDYFLDWDRRALPVVRSRLEILPSLAVVLSVLHVERVG